MAGYHSRVPAIVDYPNVLKQMSQRGLVCQYPNGGAFGFPGSIQTQIRGWIGQADPTIRSELLPMTRLIPPPIESNLANLVSRAWLEIFPGKAWIMPASHWSFELQHGNADWLQPAIREIGLDPAGLSGLTNAAAVEFSETESIPFIKLAGKLLGNLVSSDFFIAFPEHFVACTLHHHKQIWWITPDAQILQCLDELPGK
jgi:hypothetical protein